MRARFVPSVISQLPLTLTKQIPGLDLWRSVVSQPQLSSSPAAQLCQEAGRQWDIGDIILVTDQGQQTCPDGGMGHATTEKTSGEARGVEIKEMKWFHLRTEMQHYAAEYCSRYWSNIQECIDSVQSKTKHWFRRSDTDLHLFLFILSHKMQKSVQSKSLLSKMAGMVSILIRYRW